MSKDEVTLQDTGERMIPAFHKGSLLYAEHYIRYLSAKKFTKGKVVLDIACGSGYGTKLLAENSKKTYGVDVDEDTVKYAQQNFASSNIEYKVGDGEKIPLDDNSVDVVITFETIEHIPNYKKFMKEVMRVLRPDGIAIVSTPNDIEFAEGNHFHLHEFEYKELLTMLQKDFTFIDSYFQATSKYVALGADAIFNTEGKLDIQTLNLAPLEQKQYLYFYLVCSNKKIAQKIDPIAAVGSHYSDRALHEMSERSRELEETYEKLRKIHAKIVDELTEAKNRSKVLEDEITAIKNSQAYKVSQKLSKAKNKIL